MINELQDAFLYFITFTITRGHSICEGDSFGYNFTTLKMCDPQYITKLVLFVGSAVSVFHLWLVCRPGEPLQPHLSSRESSMVEPVKKFSWTALSEVKCLNLSITQTQEELELLENTSSHFYPDPYLKLFC